MGSKTALHIALFTNRPIINLCNTHYVALSELINHALCEEILYVICPESTANQFHWVILSSHSIMGEGEYIFKSPL